MGRSFVITGRDGTIAVGGTGNIVEAHRPEVRYKQTNKTVDPYSAESADHTKIGRNPVSKHQIQSEYGE